LDTKLRTWTQSYIPGYENYIPAYKTEYLGTKLHTWIKISYLGTKLQTWIKVSYPGTKLHTWIKNFIPRYKTANLGSKLVRYRRLRPTVPLSGFQREVLLAEFLDYSRGLENISAQDFARFLLRFARLKEEVRTVFVLCQSRGSF
jgi:hypothetical protein